MNIGGREEERERAVEEEIKATFYTFVHLGSYTCT
jgi:hypothetical protein